MKSPILIIPMLLIMLAGSVRSAAQQFDLNDIYFDYWDNGDIFYFQWVTTGDTIKVDTLKTGAILYEIDGFFIGRTEVTNKLWNSMLDIPAKDAETELLPKTGVTVAEIDTFCARLYQATSMEWRLPSREEWLHAYHGGVFSEGYTYSGSDHVSWAGWTACNSKGKLHPVGELVPNEVHLQDMTGNAAELASDGEGLVVMGGCYLDNNPTAEQKNTAAPSSAIGFRVVSRYVMSFMDTGL